MSEDIAISIRDRLSSDDDLIYNSWINSLWNVNPGNDKERFIPSSWHCIYDRNWFCKAHHALIEKILTKCNVRVACDPSDEDQVYGYIVPGSSRCLHWIYVKSLFRRSHVGRRLMLDSFSCFDLPIDITFSTPCIRHHLGRWNLVPNRTYGICVDGG